MTAPASSHADAHARAPGTAASQHRPGLLVLHGNRLEHLAEAVFTWLADHPLAPLEEEVLLVQSNGMAEWLKMELARAHGICAAARVELPARFMWRAYRAVLGRDAVPTVLPLDKLPLTWRLMRLLADLEQEGTSSDLPVAYAPLAGFLRRGDALRRHQLALRLADLFDQYQIYRADWLEDWAAGVDRLRGLQSNAEVDKEQRWQPALWRAVLAGLGDDDERRQSTRPRLHRRFLEALRAPQRALPRRIVLFGTTHLPHQTLEALAALSAHVQVLMAVPNPCRWHWADLIEGRELLRATRRRHLPRGGRDLAAVPPEELHIHGHPLLAAWGRQSRDFVRLLDEFDDVQAARERFPVKRVDLFDEAPAHTLLAQVQARIRELVPLAEHPLAEAAPADRSIVFHVAHSAQREVEVLHDQLLHLLACPPAAPHEPVEPIEPIEPDGAGTPPPPLAPRDIVVMVPDIDAYAPAIRSVFGQHTHGQPRHIPWGVADQRERGRQPLLVALEWLLNAPHQRYTFSELRDLFDVPALAQRFGLDAEALPQLVQWAEGAGVRWGLHEAQRATLGLDACGEANSWRFGLRRMLLGFATGELDAAEAAIELDTGHALAIEPYAEVAGLDAGLAGVLAEFLGALEAWWRDQAQPRTPVAWGERLRALVQHFFLATNDAERALLAALDQALGEWLHACETAGFEEPLDMTVVREAWLAAVETPDLNKRFKAGGVTFCTLLPLRAIPFEVVCLLGMNEGDYPRRTPRSDFDLMALPRLARPGDRSRRDDDRQLMLDALLSARRVLYISWAGRSQRDNQVQPPSVLVAQLRDYLQAGWGADAVRARTTEHPLQPFGRPYFEAPPAAAGQALLFTYAREWRSAHEPVATAPPAVRGVADDEPAAAPVTLDALARFLRNPVKEFFRHRLRVRFDEIGAANLDDEAFAAAGLERWRLLDEVLKSADAALGEQAGTDEVARHVAHQLARLRRAGRLPLRGPGGHAETELLRTLVPMVRQRLDLLASHPLRLEPQAIRLAARAGQPDRMLMLEDRLEHRLEHRLEDRLPPLRGSGAPGEWPLWVELQAGKLAGKPSKGKPGALRADKLVLAWMRSLAAAAQGRPVQGAMVGADVWVLVAPKEARAALEAGAAHETLLNLMQAMREGLSGDAPLPTAVRTGLAFLRANSAQAQSVYEGADQPGRAGARGEGAEECLARLAPDFASLVALPGFQDATRRLYLPYQAWIETHVILHALPGAVATDDEDDDAQGEG